MNKPLKLIKIGNSTGVILPKDVLARMNVEQGDEIYLSETSDGRISLDRYDADFARKMEMAEQIMREDRDILRVLAK
jgi:putative addiction module antidote